MIFCYRNSIDLVYVEILSDGLKTTYTIVISSSKLVTLYLAVRPLAVECLRDQLWVHCYFCFILMICQTVQANYPSEYLLLTLICFNYTVNNLHNLESVMNEEFKSVSAVPLTNYL